VNIAIPGYGAIAREHALSMRRISRLAIDAEITISGVMGRLLVPARDVANEFGIALATTDLDDLLGDSRVEEILVCTPTELHAEHTEQALSAGTHVLCKIPLATSLEETDHVIDLAERSGLRLLVCHTQRYTSPLIEAPAATSRWPSTRCMRRPIPTSS
jgi:2-hydroxy-4-carboxymuconate semialdehyde hemiacetal dehydrogenase